MDEEWNRVRMGEEKGCKDSKGRRRKRIEKKGKVSKEELGLQKGEIVRKYGEKKRRIVERRKKRGAVIGKEKG